MGERIVANELVQEAQYFKPNTALLPQGPARLNEQGEARVRQQVYQRAVAAARELKDALVMCPQLDKTGNFDGALDHALVMWDRLGQAMSAYRDKGTTFLDRFDDEEAA